LVQIFKNSRKPSFPAPQELEIISELEDEDEHAQIISRNWLHNIWKKEDADPRTQTSVIMNEQESKISLEA
jgi:hypothetical protein